MQSALATAGCSLIHDNRRLVSKDYIGDNLPEVRTIFDRRARGKPQVLRFQQFENIKIADRKEADRLDPPPDDGILDTEYCLQFQWHVLIKSRLLGDLPHS